MAAYVPGLNTSLDEEFAKGDLKRARDTAVAAREIDHSTAAIVWLGYDAPQSPDGLSSLAVAGTERAETGGRAFHGFMSGLEVSNDHGDPHMTAIGHSYGSRTVGAATQRGDGIPGVDDIVLVGSPGVGVDRAEDLKVGRDHVFVGAAENDVVTHLPSKEKGVLAAAGSALGPAGSIVVDAVHPGGSDLWFGRDPASEDFGARRFAVDPGPPLVGLGRVSIEAHSQYFDPELDSASADSIAMITAGRGHQVKQESAR